MYFDPNMRSNSKFALITAALLLMLASPVARAEIRFYVAPSGSDAQNGTSPAQPFLTVQRAQQAVRELKQRGPLTEPVTVYLSEGVYPVSYTHLRQGLHDQRKEPEHEPRRGGPLRQPAPVRRTGSGQNLRVCTKLFGQLYALQRSGGKIHLYRQRFVGQFDDDGCLPDRSDDR